MKLHNFNITGTALKGGGTSWKVLTANQILVSGKSNLSQDYEC